LIAVYFWCTFEEIALCKSSSLYNSILEMSMSASRLIAVFVLFVCITTPPVPSLAQESEESYVRETDPLVATSGRT
jgi:hypothetical protein